jgi:hypothetical protein
MVVESDGSSSWLGQYEYNSYEQETKEILTLVDTD